MDSVLAFVSNIAIGRPTSEQYTIASDINLGLASLEFQLYEPICFLRNYTEIGKDYFVCFTKVG